MRAERRVLPSVYAVDGLLLQRWVGAGREIDENFLDHPDVGVLERLHLPEALRGWAFTIVSGVENEAEPTLRLLETLVLAQMDRNGERHMAKELHIIHAVSGTVELFDRMWLPHQSGRTVGGC